MFSSLRKIWKIFILQGIKPFLRHYIKFLAIKTLCVFFNFLQTGFFYPFHGSRSRLRASNSSCIAWGHCRVYSIYFIKTWLYKYDFWVVCTLDIPGNVYEVLVWNTVYLLSKACKNNLWSFVYIIQWFWGNYCLRHNFELDRTYQR